MVCDMSLPQSVDKGIIALQNSLTKDYLDLANGTWSNGVVQTWYGYERNHDHGYMNQLWMMLEVPNEPGTYHIFNLFYGVFMGVYLNERLDRHQVRCNPCSIGSPAIKWKSIPKGLDSQRLVWAMNPGRVLDIELSNMPNTARASPRGGGTRQYWHVYGGYGLITPGSRSQQASWMSLVNGSNKLNTLNIPATHQSLALHAKASQGEADPVGWHRNPLDNPRCQNRSPYEQLCAGIRCLDCRFNVWKSTNGESSCLYAYHGSGIILYAEEGYSLAAVLHSVRFFLQEHPTETVIVRIRNEARTPGFLEAFENDYKHFNHDGLDPMYFNTGGRCMNDVSLNEARGKMILLFYDVTEDHGKYGADEAVFWGPKGSTYLEEEPWQNASTKVERNEKFLFLARLDANVRRVRRMGWNISTWYWNPSFWFHEHHQDISRVMSEPKLGLGGQYRIGLVDFDFYEQVQDAVDNMIRSNQGCEGLQL